MQPKRNPMATVLAIPSFRQRKVRPKKGKGSYSRKGRSNDRPSSFVVTIR